MTEPLEVAEDLGEFMAEMQLYRQPDNTIKARIAIEDEDAVVVEVPPHMAQMLPQAIFMIKQQAENGE